MSIPIRRRLLPVSPALLGLLPATLASAVALSLPAPQAVAQTRPQRIAPPAGGDQSAYIISTLLNEGKIMRPSEARRGMKGYALSVFQGTQIQKFPVEVLGTLQKVMGGGDLVLIRVTGGPVVERQSGIIQGMSGSPVYIDGKMLGAIAIGFGFPKEPIGGVTPITQMIATALPDSSSQPNPAGKARPGPGASGPNQSQKAAGTSATAASRQRSAAFTVPGREEVYRPQGPLNVAGHSVDRVVVSLDPARADIERRAGRTEMTMRPCTRLVQLSGVSQASLPRWRELFEPMGFTPVVGGAPLSDGQFRQVFGMPSQKRGVVASLVPGAAIGVQMASGDLDMTGVGTVTFRWGNRVLAFGHPMFSLGAVSMPMTTAYVHDIFPAYDISFKLASPIATVGALQQDTAYAIGGTIGKVAETIPVTVSVRDAARHIDREFKVRAIKNPTFTPSLALNIAAEALSGTLGTDSDKMLRVGLRLQLEGGRTIERQNYVYAPGALLRDAAADLMDALVLTQLNPFERGALKSLSYSVTVEPVRKTARIRRISVDKSRVKAGEDVTVSVLLDPYSKDSVRPITRTFVVKVPADSPDGVLRLVAAPASSYWSARARAGGAPPRPTNLNTLLDAYSAVGAADELLLFASTPQKYLVVDRTKVPAPSALWNRLLTGRGGAAAPAFNEVVEQRGAAGLSLSGMEALSVPVESNRPSDRKRPDAPSSEAASTAVAQSTETDGTSGTFLVMDDAGEEGIMVSRLLWNVRPAGLSDPYAQNIPSLNRWFAALVQPLAAAPGAAAAEPAKTTAPAAAGTTVVATPGVTPTPTATPTPTPDPNAGAIARPAGHWSQRGAADFGRGQTLGTWVRSDGLVVPGRAMAPANSTPEPIAWSVAAGQDGSAYLGTGNFARLYRRQGSTWSTLFEAGPDRPEVAVSALAVATNGDVYAGISPSGEILRFVGGQGKPQLVARFQEYFVHQLRFDGAGNLWVATGGGRGAVYALENPAKLANVAPSPLAVVDQPHVTALWVEGDTVTVGTGDDAQILRFNRTAPQQIQTLYQAPRSRPAEPQAGGGSTTVQTVTAVGAAGAAGQGNATLLISSGESAGATGASAVAGSNQVSGLVVRDGRVYFGLLSSGAVWSWTPQAGAKEAFKTPGRAVYALAEVPGEILAGTDGGELWAVAPKAEENGAPWIGRRLLDAPQPQVTAIGTAGGQVFAATSSNAALYQLGGTEPNSEFRSNIFDAGFPVKWGGAALNLVTLAEPRSLPAAINAGDMGVKLEVRSGNAQDPDDTWSSWLKVDLLPGAFGWVSGHNPAPAARYLQYRLTFDGARSGAATANNLAVSVVDFTFRAPNRAPVVQWTGLKAGDAISGKKTVTWNASDPDGDALRYALYVSGGEGEEWRPVDLRNPATASQELDTSTWKDGVYRLRVVATDAGRNPDNPLRAESISEAFAVDNTKPLVSPLEVVAHGSYWTVRASAVDAQSRLAGAEWRLIPEPKKPADAKKSDAKADSGKTGVAKAEPAKSATVKEEAGRAEPSKTPALAPADKTLEKAIEESTGGTATTTSAKTGAASTPAPAKAAAETAAKPDWQAAGAEDGIFDGPGEVIVARLDPALFFSNAGKLKSGARLELRVRDIAGNATLVEFVLP